MLKLLFNLFLSSFLFACAHQVQTTANQDAQKLGKIIDLKTQQPISLAELINRLSQYPHILIGEQHDEPVHQQNERYLIEQINQRKPVKNVILEMLSLNQQDAVNKVQQQIKQSDLSESAISQEIGWKNWDWNTYKELIISLLHSPIHLTAANLNDNEIKTIMFGAVPLKGFYSTELAIKEKIGELIMNQHDLSCAEDCRKIIKMVEVQQFRDRRMAEKLKKSAPISILVAGNNHVRKDIGVPIHLMDYYLEPEGKQTPNSHSVSLMMKSDNNEPVTIHQADFLWITH